MSISGRERVHFRRGLIRGERSAKMITRLYQGPRIGPLATPRAFLEIEVIIVSVFVHAKIETEAGGEQGIRPREFMMLRYDMGDWGGMGHTRPPREWGSYC